MQRRWLDWQKPLLPAAAAWLVQGRAADGRCDLRNVRCVLPGARAGRLLLRTLINLCNDAKIRLIPPQVMTPGSMVDVIVPPTATTASELECSLAWMHVLREANAGLIAPLLPRLPDYHDWPAWHELALVLGGISEDLAGELLSFGEVARAAIRLQMEREASRWQVLGSLHRRYRERLQSCGRVDPHERRVQALADLEVDPREELVLIGVVDLNQLQRHVVDAYGEQALALVHAPESLADAFDAYGCVDLSYWQGRKISVTDDRLEICDRPADQAQAVVEQIADFAGRYSPEQITIGLGDEGLGETMAQAGEWADLVIHDPRGKAVHRSRPYRLLSAGIEWLREPRFSTFAALVRHPDVELWVERQVAVLRKAEAGAGAGASATTAEDAEAGASAAAPASAEGSPAPEGAAPPIDLWPEGAAAGEGGAEHPPIDLWPEGQDDAARDEAATAAIAAEAVAEASASAGPSAAASDGDGAEVIDLASRAAAGASADAERGAAEPEPAERPSTADPAGDGRIEWLTLLDKYYANHLSDAASGPWLGDAKTQRRLQLLYESVHRLFLPLAGGRRPLIEWFEPILEVLRGAYGAIDTRTTQLSEARAAAACLEIARALGSFTSAAADLQPEVDGTTAVRLVLAQAAGLRITDDPRHGQIEMLGWLELHHDPPPALVIAGFIDGAIPQAVVSDAFLPDGLRVALGLLSNRRRYARDAYLLEAIRQSREHCALVAGRAAADGEPLTPSRLLLAGEREELPGRILRLCDHERALRWALPRGAPPAGSISRFRVPPPPALAPDRPQMSVTEFGWYLRCPYRYYLKYIKRLRVVEDSGVELDAIQFGNITHEVLQHFGEDQSIADATDPERIALFLDDALDHSATAAFGRRPLPAIRIQLARLRARLHAFSRHQARHRAEGWKITACEWELPEATYLAVPGQEPMRITGKIDRIDQNQHSGAWMIVDYKTSESGKRPEATHQAPKSSSRTWEDLQLPLYRHLAYMNLPKKPEDAAIHVARWNQENLDEAIEVAREIVRNVRAGRFEMADDYPGHYQDDFSNICQTRVFGGGDDELGEGGAEAEA
ncbi:MAG: PD-(D/E)XK nuclease family protein [Myxococcales bacterium]|nr:PD-(D/E)XK nuclease family protein [Myxococcales bacterium]